MHRTVRTLFLLLIGLAAGATVGAQAPTLRVERTSDDVVLTLGPIVLPAHAGHDGVDQPPPLTVAFGADGWIMGYSVELVDTSGKAIPRVVLHHVNVIVPAKRELFSDIMLRIAAASAETSPVAMPSVIGYRVRPSDSLLVSAMFHNPTPESYVATLRIRFRFKSAHSFVKAVGIYPFYLDVMPPAGSHSFDVPAGHSEHYWEGKPSVEGRILGVSGHLHKYGTLLKLEDRTTGDLMWQVKPETDSTGDISAIPIASFLSHLGLKIYPDHVYRLTAVYDNPTGATIVDDGMGALGGVFVPSRGTAWPGIDRESADYKTDYRLTYRLDGMQMHGMMNHQPPEHP
ncbi:MAG TPA: hypothetical protein VN706_16420 [Gemmatimonadaceae bacterium]|nr:hypothetical protein [Gemmatimonadaceae bacterium]